MKKSNWAAVESDPSKFSQLAKALGAKVLDWAYARTVHFVVLGGMYCSLQLAMCGMYCPL